MTLKILERFDELRPTNTARIKDAKEDGQKVVGLYCTYGPKEIIEAAGAWPLILCGTTDKPISAAEADLPRNLCSLIKSSYGFGITDTCPFFHFSDLVVTENTCDGKKKMYELMKDIKPMYVMQLPQESETEESVEFYKNELIKLKEHLEKTFDVTITDEAVYDAIKTNNEFNRLQRSLWDLNKSKPAVISGKDLLRAVWQTGFNVNPEEKTEMFKELIKEIKETNHTVGDENTPRILVTGSPMGLGCEKVIDLTEESGAVVVVQEHCCAYKPISVETDEEKAKDDLYLELARRYVNIPCSVMSPNTKRFDLIKNLAKDFQVDGIIDLSWLACHTYNIESKPLGDMIKEELNLPYLHIETEYSDADIEQLRVRINAFVEML